MAQPVVAAGPSSSSSPTAITPGPSTSAPNLQPSHPYKGFVAGVFSGITKLTVGHPFDTVKVRLQTAPPAQFRGPMDCVRKTLGREGVRGLYKGATPPLVGWMFMDSILLGSMTTYRNLLMKYYYTNLPPKSEIPAIGAAMSGLFAGWTVSFVATPVEHLKARLQVQYHDPRHHHPIKGIISTANATTVAGSLATAGSSPQQLFGPISLTRHILRQHGLPVLLTHGLFATLLFRSNFAVMWYSYHHISHFLRDNPTTSSLPEPIINFIGGGLGAQLYWITAYPFDVIKQRVMVDKLVGVPRGVKKSDGVLGRLGLIWTGELGYAGGEKYGKNWWRAAKGVYTEGGAGWRGYWRGFAPCFLRAFPANAAALAVFEGVMRGLPG